MVCCSFIAYIIGSALLEKNRSLNKELRDKSVCIISISQCKYVVLMMWLFLVLCVSSVCVFCREIVIFFLH